MQASNKDPEIADTYGRGAENYDYRDDVIVIDVSATTTTFHRSGNDRPTEIDKNAFETMLDAYGYERIVGEESDVVREDCPFVIDGPKLAERAYNDGYDRYKDSDVARGHVELSPEIELIPSDTARFANHIMPGYRAMAGSTDYHGGTYQEPNRVAVITPDGKYTTRSHNLADGLLETARKGAFDVCTGEDRDPPERIGR